MTEKLNFISLCGFIKYALSKRRGSNRIFITYLHLGVYCFDVLLGTCMQIACARKWAAIVII